MKFANAGRFFSSLPRILHHAELHEPGGDRARKADNHSEGGGRDSSYRVDVAVDLPVEVVENLDDPHNSGDEAEIAEQGVQGVHARPVFLRVPLRRQEKEADRHPACPHPPTVSFVETVSPQVPQVLVADSSDARRRKFDGEDVSFFVLDEIAIASSVGVAHYDIFIGLHHKVFSVSRVKGPTRGECLESAIVTVRHCGLEEVRAVAWRRAVA